VGSGLLLGYLWGHDIGYHDRINDEVNAQLRRRIYETGSTHERA
jgi:hypothetical protein